MKRTFYPFVIALAALVAFSACGKKGPDEPEIKDTPVTGVNLNTKSQAIEIGEEFPLTPTVEPQDATDKSVTWDSSDDTIATVGDNGVVKGISEGEAVITVTTVDGGFTAECKIEVAAEVIAVTGVTLSVTEARSIDKGDTFTLKATVAPATATNRAVDWDFDETVVSVEADPADATQMIVTGLAGGETTITVSTEELDADRNPFTAELEVTVSVPLKGITVSPNNATVLPGDTALFEVSFDPADATDKNFTCAITAGDGTIASAALSTENENAVVVTGISAGNTALRVTAAAKGADGNDIWSAAAITVPNLITALELDQSSFTMEVYEQVTLTPTFTPTDATVKTLVWESSDTAVATVTNGVVAGTGAGGPVTITAKTTDGSNIVATCTVYVEEAGVEHPFGVVGFRSEKTWEGGGYIWSDYVTGSRCNKDTIDTAVSNTNGDCMQNIDGGTTYYQLFSFAAVDKYKTVLCAGGWRMPLPAEYQALDLELYPRATPTPWADRYDQSGSAEYVSKWGAEYGGYYDAGSFVGRGSECWLYTGYSAAAGRLSVVTLKADAISVNQIGTATDRSTYNRALAVRCVKDAE